jgi:hypothetical protein
MHNHEHEVNIKVKPIEGLCISAHLAQRKCLLLQSFTKVVPQQLLALTRG